MKIARQPADAGRIRLLLLAGTAEARDLAERLAGRPDLAVTISLAGATRHPQPLPWPTRSGGFGGAAAQEVFLRAGGFTHVIDATHPFAAAISARTAGICRALGLPRLLLQRPGWTAGPGDDWRSAADEAAAAALIPPGATVFLATGRQSLPRFAGLAGCSVYLRQIDPPDAPFPLPRGGFVIGRPPFPVAEEVDLFRRLGIDWLVVKNSGGEASRSKLDAARQLQIPVVMLDRPPPPPGPVAKTVAEALDWLAEGTG